MWIVIYDGLSGNIISVPYTRAIENELKAFMFCVNDSWMIV